MVAAKTIKRLVQLSAAGLIVLTLIIFVQWEDISYTSSFKRRSFGLIGTGQDTANDEELLALERELDVNRLLKKVERDVALRIEKNEGITSERHHKRRLVNNGKFSENSSSTQHPISHSAEPPHDTPLPRPKTDQSRDKNRKAPRERKQRRRDRKFKWQTSQWRPHMIGKLNVHVWQAWCGNTIHDLRRNWFFPLYPDLRLTVSRFHVKHYEEDYGQRIFGYLHPPLTGKYLFALSSDDTSELWLSTDENPENVRLIGWVGNRTGFQGDYRTNAAEFTKYNSQLSQELYLEKGHKYFIEALHKQGSRQDHILVGWKIPGLPGFRYITGNSISMYINDPDASPDVTHYAGYIPQTLPSHTHPRSWSVALNSEVHKFGTNNGPDVKHRRNKPHYYNLDNMLWRCKYEPSYLIKNFTLKRYEGVGLIHDSAVYPNDNTAFTHMKQFDKCLHRRSTDSHGNNLTMTNPKFSNHSLYDEGSIRVFGPAGHGSVVTMHSDLSDAYPIDGDNADGRHSEKPVVRSLEESVKILVQVYKDANISQTYPSQDETIQRNDPRFSFSHHGNTKQFDPRNNNHGNTNQFDPRNNNHGNTNQFDARNNNHGNANQFDPRNNNHGNTNQFDPRNNNHGNTNQFHSRTNYHGNTIQFDLKGRNSEEATRTAPMHVRPKRVRRDTNQIENVESLRNHMDQAALSDSRNSQQQEQHGGQQANIDTSRKQATNQGPRISMQQLHREFLDKLSRKAIQALQTVQKNLQPVNKAPKKVTQNLQKRDSKQVYQNPKQVYQVARQHDPDQRPSNQNSQPVNQNSEQFKQVHKPVNEVPKQVNEDTKQVSQVSKQVKQDPYSNDGNRRATLRKLMVSPQDNQAQVQPTRMAQTGTKTAEVVPFDPAKQNDSHREFLYNDAMLARIATARDYVRRMIKVVQIYKYPVSSKRLKDTIYRRFGINMDVPDLQYYTEYDPWLYHQNTTKCATDGNILLNDNIAHSVVLQYIRYLNRYMPNRFRLEKAINVEENHDVINGDRYLVELELFDFQANQTVRVSQYVYQQIGSQDFCSPHNFQIHHQAMVHVIIPVKNQGRWVQYFIEDMSELYVKTGDVNINVIIVDFSSTDIDIQEAFERSPLTRYRVITLTGPFQRAFGIQAGAAVITNPNDIIFMCDLHLDLPNNMIDIIRKHCIQGRMAFAPIVTRLHCGFTPTIPYGFWELQGYGLFAIYKSDFNRVGGMNYREFGTRWGGEDWELLDRVLLTHMEVERLRIPSFYHFYHSKKGMWGSPTVDTVHSDIGAQYYRNKDQIIPPYRKARTLTAQDYKNYQISSVQRQRNLRPKRVGPSLVIHQSYRVRQGYRQPKQPKAFDKNGGRIYK